MTKSRCKLWTRKSVKSTWDIAIMTNITNIKSRQEVKNMVVKAKKKKLEVFATKRQLY